jgi:hypothetical protein
MSTRDPDEADAIEPTDEEPQPTGERQAAINRENDPPA